jgi:hypothetical protein
MQCPECNSPVDNHLDSEEVRHKLLGMYSVTINEERKHAIRQVYRMLNFNVKDLDECS